MGIRKKTPEGMLKASIRQLLDVCGIFHWNVFTGPMGHKGVSDILCCHNGRLIAIETKVPGKYPNPDQREFIRRINESGGLAFVARSLEDVIETLQLGDRFLNFR